MKKMMMIAAVIAMAACSQAASLAWGSGTIAMRTADNSGPLIGALVQLMVWDGDSFAAMDTTLTLGTVGNKGLFSGVWGGGEGYTVAAFPAGAQFYYQVFNNGAGTGTPMHLYANGMNNATPTYWTLTSITDGDAAQALALSENGYTVPVVFTPVPEPTSMALLALGLAAFGLRRKFRK